MNMNFYESCYDIAALSTCVLRDNDRIDESFWDTRVQVPFTDSLSAIAKYEGITSDEMSMSDYEFHYFELEFLRDGQLLDYFRYQKKIPHLRIGELHNKGLDLNSKLSAIQEFRPGIGSKIKAFGAKTYLTNEEIDAVIKKAEELRASVKELQENQSMGR